MSDKRSVHTDALATLGTVINASQKRDAIHIAVEPAVAMEMLRPGQPVDYRGGKAYPCTYEHALGIVDPFLKDTVDEGDHFWLLVMPRTITSLRHVWEHPSFPSTNPEQLIAVKSESEAWLRFFCAQSDCPSYEVVMEVIQKGEVGEGYEHSYMDEERIHFGGVDAHSEIPNEFWDHVEVVTGRKFDKRPTYFSCSC